MNTQVLSAKFAVLLFSLLLAGSGIFFRTMTAAQSLPSSSETAHWRTFRSEKYGFELKYPPGLVISKDSGGYVVFRAPHADARFGLTISRLRQRGKLTLAEFVHNDTAYEKDRSYSYASESVKSREGMTIYRFQRILGSSTRQGVFFLKNRHEGIMADYLVEYDRCGGGGCGEGEHSGQRMVKDPHTKQYQQILSSFRFIETAAGGGGQ